MTSKPIGALRYFLSRHVALSAILLAVLLLSAMLEGLTAASLFPFVSAVIGQGTTGKGGPIIEILNQLVSVVPFQDAIQAAMLLLVGVVILKGMITLVREALIAYGASRIVHEIKMALLSRLACAPYPYFLQCRDGDLSYRLSTAPQNLGVVLLLLPYAVVQVFTIAAIVALLASIDLKLTMGVAFVGAVIYGLIHLASMKVSYVIGKGRANALANELGIAIEFLRGIREIIVTRAATFWAERFEVESDRFRKLYARDHVWQNVPRVLIEMGFFLSITVLVLLYRARAGDQPEGFLPIVVVYAYALYRLVGAISTFSAYKMRIGSNLADVEALHNAIQTTPQQPPDVGRNDLTMNKTLIFEGVSYVYPGRHEPAVRDIGFEIKKGAVTAIVGASGVGKSTVVNLLTRLLEPTKGRILVDGEDLNRFRRDAWLCRIGYVGQDTFIFNATVEENIRFGLASSVQGEVEAAATAAQAHEFILNLPQGYRTVVGERGTSLSGGQRQRIAIARALLRKPEILIFDEATSALDSASESLIQQAISQLARDHTIILVAHRLSTVRYADQIVVLDRGRVIETGTHGELLARKGRYSLMVAAAE